MAGRLFLLQVGAAGIGITALTSRHRQVENMVLLSAHFGIAPAGSARESPRFLQVNNGKYLPCEWV
jgi:hypothetical protein